MQSTNKEVTRIQPARFLATLTVGLVLLMGGARWCLAQQAKPETFASAEQASQALFAAVKGDNEQALTEIFGGKKDLVSGGDSLEDQHDRETFEQKYQEMHRVVQEPDGTFTLYVGAENWPFPVPLVSKNGTWYFDADAGAQEVLFRQIGRNEDNAIETSLVLAGTTASPHTPAEQQAPTLSDGYYFRKVVEPRSSGGEKTIVIAYPAEYRSSGVLTYVVSPKDVVYAKDLGPQTETVAKSMTTWKPDRSWHVVK